MTLSTKIYIQDPVNPMEVFIAMRRIIGVPRDADYRYTVEGPSKYRRASIMAEPGQGYDAWLLIYYNEDGSPIPAEEPDEDGYIHPAPSHYVVVDVDTGYSYMGPDGESCGDLHASYIVRLAEWLQKNDAPTFSWMNEYTGEVHEGLNNLSSLGESGMASRSWLSDVVMPAIQAKILEEGA